MLSSPLCKKTSIKPGTRLSRMLLLFGAVSLPGAIHARPAAYTPATARFSVAIPAQQPSTVVRAAQVNNRYGCHGINRSPPLIWRNPPANTHGYAVTIYDIDAPGHGWWHWAVANLPTTYQGRPLRGLPENASASGFIEKLGGIEARNDFGANGYGGPCPPAGKVHRYIIKVYALDNFDNRLSAGRPAPMYEHEIGLTALAVASMTVTYQR
jgi:Raf kinase inhibitor-like YbhB/YbcL family protein